MTIKTTCRLDLSHYTRIPEYYREIVATVN